MGDALDMNGASEAIGLRVIAYYLYEEVRDVHEGQLCSVAEDTEEEVFGHSLSCTWYDVVETLLKRFLTDGVLHAAYNAVTRCAEKEGEDEANFATRLAKSRTRYRHVLRKADVVNYFVCGMKPSVREVVSQHGLLLPMEERTNIVSVKQVAVVWEVHRGH